MKPIKPRYRLIVLFLCLVLVILPACSDKNSLALDKSFTLAEFGTLQYPKSWSQIQDPPNAILGPDSISISKTDMYVSIQALAKYENASAAAQSMISKSSVLKGPEPYQLDGSDGVFVEYEGGGPNGAFQYHHILIIAPHPTSGKLVGIWLNAKVDNWSAFSPTALAMIDTFKWAR